MARRDGGDVNNDTYTLFYRDVEIGTVLQKDFDFPSAWGEFEPSAKTDHP
jgi:hypothetical protein